MSDRGNIKIGDVGRAALCAPQKHLLNKEINNGEICFVVNSQSGLTTWQFTVDFNDYGQLSGTYWLSSENKDSVLPDKIANSIRSEIQGKSKVIK